MNCTMIQRRLLGAERPDLPPPEVRAHLADCLDCRTVLQELVRLEEGLAHLPVPASEGKAAFVLQFLTATTPVRQVPKALRLKEGGRRKVAVAFGLAAGLLICALAMWAWTNRPPEEGGSLPPVAQAGIDRQEQLKKWLASARTGPERVKQLADLADHVLAEAREHLTDADRLGEVSRFYVQVVHEHLLTQARDLPKAERAALLPAVAERLRLGESQLSRLAADAQLAGCRASFHAMATAARDGDRTQQALARGEAA
jgi:hypothetical protein